MGLAAVGVALWIGLWSIQRPRAYYDTLWYSLFTYQDAGVPLSAAWDESWQFVSEYADPSVMSAIQRTPDGSWFPAYRDPARQRWIGIYRMRPMMPALGALAEPVLGIQAPIVVSLLAVVTLVLGAGLLLPLLDSSVTAVALVALMAVNPLSSRWLVFLIPDGLGLALWFLTLGLAAAYVARGGRSWLVASALAALALAFTRPSALVIPVALAGAAAVALFSRRGPWRRLAAAAVGTAAAVAIFTAYAAAAGLPSFADQLQDIPTNHFSVPDIANPVGYTLRLDASLARAVVREAPSSPAILLALLGAALGYLIDRRWWTVPFAASVLVAPLLVAAHPIGSELPRTIAPAWIGIDVGLSLLAAAGLRWLRRQQHRAAGGAAIARL